MLGRSLSGPFNARMQRFFSFLALYGFQTGRIFCANSPSQQARGASYNLLLLLRKDGLFCHRSECYGPPSPSISLESIKSLSDFSQTEPLPIIPYLPHVDLRYHNVMKSKSRTGPQLQPFYWEEVILIALSALAVAGLWWLFHGLVFPKQAPSTQIRSNLPPIAIPIHIRAVAGERIVVDVREYIYDPEGEIPRILGLGSPAASTTSNASSAFSSAPRTGTASYCCSALRTAAAITGSTVDLPRPGPMPSRDR